MKGGEIIVKHKKIILPVLALVAAGIVVFGIPQSANAQTPGEGVQTLIQKIAQKFGLKQADVQSVFDEHKKEMGTKREANYEARLTTLVTEGKITEAQKQLILAKHTELQSKREANRTAMQNMTAEQRKAAMEAHKTELESWAKQNNIDVKYLFGGDMKGRGMKMMMMK